MTEEILLRQYHTLISDYFPREDVPNGEVGIEIEVEGVNLPTHIPSYWNYHTDGSLRGESAEYVLIKPIKRENVTPYLEYLQGKLKNSVIHDSPRTSVHVHVNMAHRTVLQVYIILIVYFILENIIIELAGKNRVGNLFCLRVRDAEFLLSSLVKAAQKDNYNVFSSEQSLRYSAANICALPKFNSLEFRAMRGTVDPVVISEWVSILLSVVDQAVINYKTPLEVIQDFSAIGAEQFALKILGLHMEKFSGHNIHKILWEGLRTVQELAYCTDWAYTDYIPVRKLFTKKESVWRSPPSAIRVAPRALRAEPITTSDSIDTQVVSRYIRDTTPPPLPASATWPGTSFTNFVVQSQNTSETALQVAERNMEELRVAQENDRLNRELDQALERLRRTPR